MQTRTRTKLTCRANGEIDGLVNRMRVVRDRHCRRTVVVVVVVARASPRDNANQRHQH